MNISDFKRQLEHQMSASDAVMQTHVIGTLISQVKEFVVKTKAQGNLVKDIPELERTAAQEPKSPAEEKEKEEAQRLLQTAQDLRRTVQSRKQFLSKLENEVTDLLRAIKS